MMMRTAYFIKLIVLFTIFFPNYLCCQHLSKFDYLFRYDWSVNINWGVTNFFGDLDNNWNTGFFNKNKTAYGIIISKSFGSVISFGGQFLTGRLTGAKITDKNNNPVNLYFETIFIEYNMNTSLNLNNLFYPDKNQNKVNIYAILGLGFIDFRSKLYDIPTDAEIRNFGYDGKKATTESIVPFGIRLTYLLDDKFNICIETTSRRVNTDKLDVTIGNDNSDYYNYTSLGLIFIIEELYKKDPLDKILKQREQRRKEIEEKLKEKREIRLKRKK
ncbi:MAG: hypothetical protein K8R58_02395 [Bacteroidales bacterium]|nr:hypothetical protein [Bacteroidales bacterium]